MVAIKRESAHGSVFYPGDDGTTHENPRSIYFNHPLQPDINSFSVIYHLLSVKIVSLAVEGTIPSFFQSEFIIPRHNPLGVASSRFVTVRISDFAARK